MITKLCSIRPFQSNHFIIQSPKVLNGLFLALKMLGKLTPVVLFPNLGEGDCSKIQDCFYIYNVSFCNHKTIQLFDTILMLLFLTQATKLLLLFRTLTLPKFTSKRFLRTGSRFSSFKTFSTCSQKRSSGIDFNKQFFFEKTCIQA